MVRRMLKAPLKPVDGKNKAYTPPKIVKSWQLVVRAQIPSNPPPGP